MTPNDERVLVLSALPVDAEAVAAVAAGAGIAAQPCADMGEFCERIREGAGAAVVSEFALSPAAFDALATTMKAQPAWSDLPLIFLSMPGHTLESQEALDTIRNLGNVVVLDCPLSVATLVTALRGALRARRRQYELRRSHERLEKSLDDLRDSERHFRELADLMPQLVWVADETGSIVYANRQWSEQIGVSVEESLGYGWLHALHPEDRDSSLAALRRSVETGAPYQSEHRLRVRSGEYRWHLCRGIPIRDQQGRITRWFGTSTDIEDTKRAEERMRKSQKLESVGMLAGGIAHDFNNIMTGIMGNASLLLTDASADQAEQLERIVASTERAALLTRQLLAYSGKGQFVIQDVDVSDAVGRMASLVRPSLPRSVDVRIDAGDGLPAVRMDSSQFEQIIVNLLMNAGEAIGHEKPGRITLKASTTDIDTPFVDASGEEVAAGRYVAIEVSDTGQGIEENAKSKIFDPFFSTKFLGRGLGLAAVAGIVRAKKGGVTLETVPGRGSTFRVLLPPVKKRKARAKEEPRTALVVDDEPDVRKFIATVLRQKGYRVVTASNGDEAVALGEREAWKIDAAVVDIIMPVMDATRLIPALKARQPNMRILLTSAYDLPEAERLASIYAGAAFIQKPYTAQQLAEAMEQLVGAKGQNGGQPHSPSALEIQELG